MKIQSRLSKADLDDRLYRMYDKIDEQEQSLIEAKAKKQSMCSTEQDILKLGDKGFKRYVMSAHRWEQIFRDMR